MATVADGGAANRKAIFRTTGILAGLTALEFIVAGIKGYIPDWLGISENTVWVMVVIFFVILTIVKAFFIMAEFMHLKHEVKKLAYTIILPFLFIVWLIIGLILEGGYWGRQDAVKQTAFESGYEYVIPAVRNEA
ncbi:MAG: cytochrome C oxidase subunit IV family protein [Bacteroidota bacterium]